MKKYINIADKKQKSVLANNAPEAAQIFATRTAKKVYGKNSWATLTIDSWQPESSREGVTLYNYKALLRTTRGRRPNEYEIGCNINVYPREK